MLKKRRQKKLPDNKPKLFEKIFLRWWELSQTQKKVATERIRKDKKDVVNQTYLGPFLKSKCKEPEL